MTGIFQEKSHDLEMLVIINLWGWWKVCSNLCKWEL